MAVSDPRVQFAIRRACEKRARKLARRQVEAALERVGAASSRELAELTGLPWVAAARAIDELRIDGRAVEEPEGVFCWAAGDEAERSGGRARTSTR